MEIICTKCGQEITIGGRDSDEAKGNYREMPHVGGADYKHIKCPGQTDRTKITAADIDLDAPLPEANPSSWIVK